MTDNTKYDSEALEKMKGHLNILEVYPASGQGEGVLTGVPSTFVRTAGCSVGCAFCDTKYSWATKNASANWETLDYLIGHVKLCGLRHIVVTGGEPLQQHLPTLQTFLNMLHTEGYHVTVETSGNFAEYSTIEQQREFLQGISDDVFWSLSPKLPSAYSNQAPLTTEFFDFWIGATKNRQFKLVFSSVSEITEWMPKFLLVSASRYLQNHVVFQPVTPSYHKSLTEGSQKIVLLDLWRAGQEEVMRILQLDAEGLYDKFTFMVRPQTHYFLYDRKRLV